MSIPPLLLPNPTAPQGIHQRPHEIYGFTCLIVSCTARLDVKSVAAPPPKLGNQILLWMKLGDWWVFSTFYKVAIGCHRLLVLSSIAAIPGNLSRTAFSALILDPKLRLPGAEAFQLLHWRHLGDGRLGCNRSLIGDKRVTCTACNVLYTKQMWRER